MATTTESNAGSSVARTDSASPASVHCGAPSRGGNVNAVGSPTLNARLTSRPVDVPVAVTLTNCVSPDGTPASGATIAAPGAPA